LPKVNTRKDVSKQVGLKERNYYKLREIKLINLMYSDFIESIIQGIIKSFQEQYGKITNKREIQKLNSQFK
jgi:hypothetical protein